eukprot:scaffold6511_cov112-Isochrysis_galbana.AAC.1
MAPGGRDGHEHARALGGLLELVQRRLRDVHLLGRDLQLLVRALQALHLLNQQAERSGVNAIQRRRRSRGASARGAGGAAGRDAGGPGGVARLSSCGDVAGEAGGWPARRGASDGADGRDESAHPRATS